MLRINVVWIFLNALLNVVSSLDVDVNGYVAYCPCMGRFGNQADHFLGSLAFTRSLNRTLILPPWVEYRMGESKSIQVPFNNYFKVEALQEYHKVILMEEFMEKYAESIWPPEERTAFCYTSRMGDTQNSCNAKDGNPFGPFWDTFHIDFPKSVFYGPLTYDTYHKDNIEKWMKTYPPSKFPVIAFTGAPASFPVQAENRHLQKYLQWTDKIHNKARAFIKENMSGGSFIGIHLRNGADWVRACDHVSETPLLFSAPQCVGYNNERGAVTNAMCFPSKQDIIRRIKRAIRHIKDVKFIFVASDANHMIDELQLVFQNVNIKLFKLSKSDPHLDLAILGQSNFFIGNCVSSFSAFVKRERDSASLPSGFWAFPNEKSRKHDEL